MDLSTNYLGLTLKNPFIAGASPLTEQCEAVQELEANGVAAVVMPSLYEERIDAADDIGAGQFFGSSGPTAYRCDYFNRSPLDPLNYVKRIQRIKNCVSIPVFGSVSITTICHDTPSWLRYLPMFQDTGANGIELNIFSTASEPSTSSQVIEDHILELVGKARHVVNVPIAVKLSPFYTALPNLLRGLERAGADGVVLFSRAFQADIDVAKRLATPKLQLSQVADSAELRLRLRWMAMLAPSTHLSLALTGGVHTGLDAIKGIMCGAHAIQVVSCLLNAGPTYISSLLEQLRGQMKLTDATSVKSIQGCLKYSSDKDSAFEERAHYVAALNSWPA